ncbi:MAG: hypothetical protein R2684_12335 [Pyrinomonadaceae bacterium]
MKLRIRGNTIRLRLLKSEVGQLQADGAVREETGFGSGSRFAYSIRSADVPDVTASFENGEIIIGVPFELVAAWAESEEVGIAGSQETPGGNLEILIEKDFVCLTRKDDPDNLDAWPNPEDTAC